MQYEYIGRYLPENITFVTTQELEDMYPDCTPKEREYKHCEAARCGIY